MSENDHLHDDEQKKHSLIHWVPWVDEDGEEALVLVDEYEEYLNQIAEEIQWKTDMRYYDRGEVITTWKEDGEIEADFCLIHERKGTLLKHDAAPELSEEAFSNWDVFLRFRDGQVEVLFGAMEARDAAQKMHSSSDLTGNGHGNDHGRHRNKPAKESHRKRNRGIPDLGLVVTTWKEDGEIVVNYGLHKGQKGVLLKHDACPEIGKEALANWDVFLRFRAGQVEVLFGNVDKQTFLPDDDPHYYDAL